MPSGAPGWPQRAPHRKLDPERDIQSGQRLCNHLAAAQRARQQDPQGFESNANARLFAALSKLIFDAVPSDPGRQEYLQGNTMGPAFRHWLRAKVGRRFS